MDLRKSVESAAPDELAWQGPVAGGSGEGTSSGEGNWHTKGRFMIHGGDESIDVLRRTLRDELRSKIEQSGAQLNEPKVASNGPIEIGYSNGKHQGKVVARIEQAPENAQKLVPDGRIPTHQLTIEVSEEVETASE